MAQLYYDNDARDDVVLVVASVSLIAASIWALWGGVIVLAVICIAVVDLYVLAILILSAIRSRDPLSADRAKWMYWPFPTRIWGLVVVLALLVGLTCGFATLYLGCEVFKEDKSTTDALYISFSTLGFNDFQPRHGYGQLVVIAHLASVIVLLMGIYALLISRISTFESPTRTPTDTTLAARGDLEELLKTAAAGLIDKSATDIAALKTQVTSLQSQLTEAQTKLKAAAPQDANKVG